MSKKTRSKKTRLKKAGRQQARNSVAAAPPATKKSGGKGVWKLMDRGSTIAAGILAQRVTATAWRAATGRKPPISGRHPDVRAGEAVAWAMVGGGLAELVKVAVRRGTSTYWVKSTGHLPPGMKPIPSRSTSDTTGLNYAGSTKQAEPAPTEPAPRRKSTKRVNRRNRGR